MVNALLVSAAFAAASIASVAQAASLKQDPLYGCELQTTGVLALGSADDAGAITGAVPVGFVAGRTGKSSITGKSKSSALSTTRNNGVAIDEQQFEFLNCTQSLIDRGYNLYVPKSLSDLSDDGLTYDYSWGIVRHSGSDNYSLSPKFAQNSNGKLDAAPLLHTRVSETPVQYRTFVLATADGGANSFLEYYPFAGTKKAPKAGKFYAASDKFGSVSVATNFTSHAGTTFLTIGAATVDDTEEEEEQ